MEEVRWLVSGTKVQRRLNWREDLYLAYWSRFQRLLTEVKFRVYYWSEVRGGFTEVKFSAGLLEEERSADSLEEGGE